MVGSSRLSMRAALSSIARVNLAGVLAIVALAWWFPRSPAGDTEERLPKWRLQFLAVLVLAPLVLTIVAGLGFQLMILAIMAVGIFPLMPLLLLQAAPALDARRCFQIAGAVAVTITVGSIPGASHRKGGLTTHEAPRPPSSPAASLPPPPPPSGTPRSAHRFAMPAATPTTPTPSASTASDHPSSFIDLSYGKSRWVTPEKLKLHGLLIACPHDDRACLGKAAGLLSGSWKQFSVSVGGTLGASRAREVAFDIFVVPPQPADGKSG